MNKTPKDAAGFYTEAGCDLSDFVALTRQQTAPETVPMAAEVSHKIPVYDMAQRRDMLEKPLTRRALMAEWAQVLQHGAGVFVLRHAYADTSVIDAATALYDRIIADEKVAKGTAADHFAAAGSNDRIWNSLQKLCEADPDVFVRYFANPTIDAACEAWLGPNYQMTAQVNVVHPGGSAQQAHRDYHLGFQTTQACAAYPAHVHDLSPLMTLQGGIAHGATPLESGPTKLLPFSQRYRPGYTAWRRDDFRSYFEEHHVQLPLEKGDALFFNPALFHAAGSNSSRDIHRMVNLLQVSSPFGRAMETVDRTKTSLLAFGSLKDLPLADAELHAAIAATAEGYPFPTNLDNDPPVGGLAPPSQQDVLKTAIAESWDQPRLEAALKAQEARKTA
ncbi:phytanoyl-CoA dioxygenase [Roseobacter denitrificans]|uniref:Phytanoyl-CoA dioxygenase n=1 Tax=Roseobacter denitrificans (strain ATCC 33942 / OCh 114) TaxID=375451 RepID=Q16CV1_ROSDO|nr:phytanoyl-CoA dioxygenase family protein [Roseobacter denitrificans]ABG30192.1 conserved hypothetical protein [Roseobacter denitrificans OCh 114]AVL53379.1 phytanoyl-CoA dioxygenase [Roseobacter denitrificans]SFF70472.1 Ectoine hydroxylase-related dioxygenase, phytanoyl-CoA dioxygenase (PhyH) family [Roseobacter denitrificans OCh 114]